MSLLLPVIAVVGLLSGCRPTPKPQIIGLAALEPRPFLREYDWLDPSYMTGQVDKVDSLQPVLRWEAFPNMKLRESGRKEIVSQIKDITYELKVWEAGWDARPVGAPLSTRQIHYFGPGSEPIYSQTGLTEPVHQVAVRLKPSTLYAWTVRARFLLAGQPRVTDWGQDFVMSLHRGGDSAFSRDIEDDFYGYYRFWTPLDK